jgi:hypothetical protein
MENYTIGYTVFTRVSGLEVSTVSLKDALAVARVLPGICDIVEYPGIVVRTFNDGKITYIDND